LLLILSAFVHDEFFCDIWVLGVGFSLALANKYLLLTEAGTHGNQSTSDKWTNPQSLN